MISVVHLTFNNISLFDVRINELDYDYRHVISLKKNMILNKMIDDVLDLQVIQTSKETTGLSPSNRKPADRWRFTVDYRGRNKVISNEKWEISNMWEMLMRIGDNPHGVSLLQTLHRDFSIAST